MLPETLEVLSQEKDFLQKNDIPRIREMVQFHRHQYYELDNPLISDEEFDRLFSLLVFLEEKFHEHHESSPTQKIDVLSENHFSKEAHLHPMMSLDNTYDAGDLREFDTRINRILEKNNSTTKDTQYVMEYKFDGLGVALLYRE